MKTMYIYKNVCLAVCLCISVHAVYMVCVNIHVCLHIIAIHDIRDNKRQAIIEL